MPVMQGTTFERKTSKGTVAALPYSMIHRTGQDIAPAQVTQGS